MLPNFTYFLQFPNTTCFWVIFGVLKIDASKHFTQSRSSKKLIIRLYLLLHFNHPKRFIYSRSSTRKTIELKVISERQIFSWLLVMRMIENITCGIVNIHWVSRIVNICQMVRVTKIHRLDIIAPIISFSVKIFVLIGNIQRPAVYSFDNAKIFMFSVLSKLAGQV